MKHYAPLSLLDQFSAALSSKTTKPRQNAFIVLQCLLKTRRHFEDEEAIPFSKDYARSLKVTTDQVMESGVFDYIPSKASKIAAGIRLKPEIKVAIKPEPSTVVDVVSGIKRRKPQGAINSRDSRGNHSTFRALDISVEQPIDLMALGQLLIDPTATERDKSSAAILIAQSSNGHIIQEYQESRAGRFYGIGQNLQNVTRAARRAATNGCTEIDMQNAHPNIIYQTATAVGLMLPVLGQYVSNPLEFREEVGDMLGIGYKEAKTLLLASTFLGHPCHSQADIVRRAGGDIDKLKEITLIKKLQQEIRQAYKVMESASPKARGGSHLVNVLGKAISLKEKTSSKLAHLVQGLESQALRAMIIGLDVSSLEHDGCSVRNTNVDLDRVRMNILEATGLDLRVEVKS